jgi:hypothetical protein
MISGRVFDACGVPVPNPIVYADPNVEPPVWIGSESDANGIYAFDSLESNKTYIVSPVVVGYVFTSQEVTTGSSNANQPTSGNVWGIDFYGEVFAVTNITPSSGPPGSYIKIEGDNFGDSPGNVIFNGGDWGEEYQWSNTLIYCRVPVNALSGDVKVSTAGSQLSGGRYFEVTNPTTIYVDDDANEIENGTTEYPFSSIQRGIDTATQTTISVYPGTYYENINFDGKSITVTSSEPNNPDVVASTIIDGNNTGPIVTFSNGEDVNSVLTGFTITDGNSSNGGIYCLGSSPTISYCVIKNNSNPSSDGGGMCNTWMDSTGSDPTLSNCTFINNTSGSRGGGIYNYESSPTLIDCSFIENLSVYGGGAIVNWWNSNPTIINCMFVSNLGTDQNGDGGAIYSAQSYPTILNCGFYGNSVEHFGGAMYSFFADSTLTITNSTFTGNSSDNDGGALYISDGGWTVINCTFSDNYAADKGAAIFNFNNLAVNDTTLSNCIFWGNTGNSEIYDHSSATAINHSCVQGGGTSNGNINDDPLFVEPGYWVDVNDANIVVEPNDPNAVWSDGNYRLWYDSPCIDIGNDSNVPADTYDIDGDANIVEPTPFDLDKRARIVDDDCNDTKIVDMGAYEFGWSYLGDFAGGCDVDFFDFAVFSLAWGSEPGDLNWNPACDLALPLDEYIYWRDLNVLCGNWLGGK